MLWEADRLGYTLWIDSSSSKSLWGHNPLHRNFEAIESSVIFTAPAWPSRTHPTLLGVQSSIHWPHVPKHSTKIYISYGTQWTLSCRGFPLVLAREKAGRCSGLRNQAKQSSRVMTDIAVPKLEKKTFFPSLQTGEKFENNIKKKKKKQVFNFFLRENCSPFLSGYIWQNIKQSSKKLDNQLVSKGKESGGKGETVA